MTRIRFCMSSSTEIRVACPCRSLHHQPQWPVAFQVLDDVFVDAPLVCLPFRRIRILTLFHVRFSLGKFNQQLTLRFSIANRLISRSRSFAVTRCIIIDDAVHLAFLFDDAYSPICFLVAQ